MNTRDAGFTLLELLIAVALLGFLTVIAYGAVRFSSLAWNHAERTCSADADRAAIARVLRQAIAHAYPGYATSVESDRTIAFTGAADQLALLTPLPDAIEPGVMAEEHFRRTADGALVMDWRLNLPSSDGEALPFTTTQMAADVTRLRFAYFGRPRPDRAGWFDQWAGMPMLPELISVEIWQRNEEAPVIRLVAATGVSTNTECVYDPSDVNCRRSR